jgi:hypothetical protein
MSNEIGFVDLLRDFIQRRISPGCEAEKGESKNDKIANINGRGQSALRVFDLKKCVYKV